MIKPTKEQVAIIEAVASGKNLRVVANAGAAKTTTLMMVADKVTKPTLYLTFNKRMADEARDKFPGWVDVRTTHSLAYRAIGHKYVDKLKRPTGGYVNVCGTASEVARYFRLRPIELRDEKRITSAAIGYAVLSTVRNFEQSSDRQLERKHVSNVGLKGRKPENVQPIRQRYVEDVYKAAVALWDLRINTRSNILAEHDTYMKLYQLSNPNLKQYDIIMLDEAQDTSDCVIDIVRQQKETQVVIVGDSKQQIYEFRGAVDALDKFDYQKLSLSKSFRFGQELADVAQKITSEPNIFGNEALTTKVIDPYKGEYTIPDKYTAIYFTNAAMLQDAVGDILGGKTVNIETDIRDFTHLIDSMIALHSGELKNVKHTQLLVYETWQELKHDLEWCSAEINRVFRMIEDRSVYQVMGVLKSHRNVDNPDVIYSTAHKSKGLEFDTVVLGSDFPSIYDSEGKRRELTRAATNLMYVAATRAKTCLVLGEQFVEILKEADAAWG